MPGGPIVVGAVAVDVVPSAQNFLGKLINQIAPSAGKLGQQVGKDVGDAIGDEAAKGVTEGVERGLKESEKSSRTSGKKSASQFADAWAQEAQRGMASAIEKINKNTEFTIPVELETSKIAGQYAELAAKQEALQKLFKDSATLDLDTDKFSAKLTEARADLAAFAAKTTSARLAFDAKQSIKDIDALNKKQRDGNAATGKWAQDFHAGLEKYIANAADHMTDLDLNSGDAGKALDRINQQVTELAGLHIGKDILDKQAVTDVEDLLAQVKGIDTTTATPKVKAQVAQAEKDLTEVALQLGIIDKKVAEPKVKPKVETPKFDASSLSGVQSVIRNTLDRALKNVPTLKIDADSSPAQRAVADVQARIAGLKAKIEMGVVGDNEAIARMREIEAIAKHVAKKYRIDFEVDKGTAGNLGLINKGLEDGLGFIKNIGNEGSTAAEGVQGLVSKMTSLTPATLAANGVIIAFLVALPALIALVVAGLFGILGLITAIGAAATVGFGVFGVAVLAIYKVIQAIQEKSAVEKAAATTAAQAAATELSNKIALRNATQAITSAEKTLAKAKVSAARQATDLTAAEKKEKQARLDLKDATKAARTELAKLTQDIKTNQVAQQAALVTITQAREAYNATLADPTASESDIEAAQAEYNTKEQALKDLQVQQRENADQKAKFDKDGLAASATYKSAMDALSSATAAVVTQQQQLADAIQSVADAKDAVAQAKQSKQDTVDQQAAAKKVDAAQTASATPEYDSLTKNAKDFVDFYTTNVKPLIDDLFKTAQDSGVFDGLKSFFGSLSTLAPTIKPLVKTLGDLAGVFLEQLGKFLAGPSGKKLIQAFEDILPTAFELLSTLTFTGLQAIVDLMVALAPVVTELAPQLSSMVKQFGLMFAQFLKSPDFQEFMKYMIKNAPMLVSLLMSLLVIVVKTMIFLAPAATKFLEIVTNLFGWLSKLSPTAVGAILTAIAIVILTALTALATAIISPFVAIGVLIAGAIALVVLIVVVAVATIRKHWEDAWTAIRKFFSDIADGIAKRVGDFFSGIGQSFTTGRKRVSDTWHGLLDDIHDAFFDRLHAIEDRAQQLWDRLRDLFSRGVQATVDVTYGLVNGVNGIVNDVTGLINDYLIKGWNIILKFVHAPTIPDIPTVPKVAAPKVAAKGAVLPGYAPGKDTEPYLLSKGEAVLVPQLTRQLGADWILSANARALRGEKIPGFAKGGVVDLTPQIISFERKANVPFTVTSAYTDRIGSNDYHGRGMAVDAADSADNMVKLASWLYGKSKYLLELIHSGGSGFFVKNGNKVGADYYRSVYDQHFSHVHTAMNQAGLNAAKIGADPDTEGTSEEPTGLAAKAAGILGDYVHDGIAKIFGDKWADSPLVTGILGIPEKVLDGFGPFIIDKVKAMAEAIVSTGKDVLHWLGIGSDDTDDGADLGTQARKAGVKAGPQSAAAYAKKAIGRYGWDAGEMESLANLWNGESGWKWNATGSLTSDGRAYGIPQSLPGSKMSAAGKDWQTNAFTQIDWGLAYIKSVYGDPATAYTKWQIRDPHWYDQGGYLPPGLTLAMNGTGRNERILTSEQEADMLADRETVLRGGLDMNIRVHDGAIPGLVEAHVDRQFGMLADASIYGGN